MPERNVKQATLIPSARAIRNAYGTAPGWWVEREGRIIIAMPGPPGEMRRMWEAEVEPELRRRSSGIVLVSRTLKTSDVTEGRVDELLGDLQARREPDRQRLLARRRHPGAHRRQGRRPRTRQTP